MLTEIGETARTAFRQMANAGTGAKNQALHNLAALIDQNQPAVLKANSSDIEAARTSWAMH